jgi:hypothetical protein
MRVAVYVRVSTSRQVMLQTIEQQLERVRKVLLHPSLPTHSTTSSTLR